ncbi:sensor histidine kinase [Brevundimonas sp. FT23042]|uniref:sensor histidine kinase n=1 Tax=Brevundimonas sp. FT23042 TaxID=3393749 RepID=UPI003B58660C
MTPPRAFLSEVRKGLRVPADWRERLRFHAPDALSWRLLGLTFLFAASVEVLIVAPSAANFHERWLLDRLQSAELASVGVEALPYSAVEDDTAEQLLAIGGVQAVVVGDQGVRRLLLQAPNLPRTPDLIDLRQRRPLARLWDPWQTLFGHPDRSIRVQARPRYRSGDFIEILAPAQPLKAELKTFLRNSLLTSLFVSLVAGGLLYAGLAFLVLQPLRRVTRSIELFARDPEAEGDAPSRRQDEIGRVERELARMQEEVRQSLRSRARLVALGEAVAKINHDLRNMLTSAQMASERLADSPDPAVAKALPRLERALGRAAALSRNVLEYGRSEEPPPQKVRAPLSSALTVAAEDAGLSPDGVRLLKALPARFNVHADPDQLYRILVNLLRNARQAIESDATRADRRGAVRVSGFTDDGDCVILISDDGPGIPPRVADRLFEAFVSGRASGGTGLGLTISRELAANNGGTLTLIETGPTGTTFELRFPN